MPAKRSAPLFESLESRILLAANVTAFNGGGMLYLIGDEQGNNITVSNPSPGTLRVTPNGGQYVNGSTALVDFAGTAGGITAILNGGDDTLQINGCTIANSITVFGGEGNNNITVFGGTIGFSISIYNGTGNDTTTLQNVTLTHWGVTIFDTAGNNSETFNHVTSINGPLYITNGFGNNTVTVNNSSNFMGGNIFNNLGQATIDADASTFSSFLMINNLGTTAGGVTWAEATTFTGCTLSAFSELNGGGANYLVIDGATTVNGDAYYGGGWGPTQVEVTGSSHLKSNLTHGGGGSGDLPSNAGYSKITWVTGSATIDGTLGGSGGGLGATWLDIDTGSTVGGVNFGGGYGAWRVSVLDSHVKSTATFSCFGLGQVPGTTAGTNALAYFINDTMDGGTNLYSGGGYENIDLESTHFNGGLSVNTGWDSSDVTVNNSPIGSSAWFYRGGGAGGPSGRSYAGVWNLTTLTVNGMLSFSAFDGNDAVTLHGVSATVGLSVNLGQGATWISLDANSSGTGCVFGYNGMQIYTGEDGGTSLYIRKTTNNGATFIRTGSAGCTMYIDDCTFNANVWAYIGSMHDYNSAVYIETGLGYTGQTTFNSVSSLYFGGGDDSLTVGVAGGSNTWVIFNVSAFGDGGPGCNSAYLNHYTTAPYVSATYTNFLC